MGNSISTGTKEFTATHPRRAREKDNSHGFRRVLSAEVIVFQPICNSYVDGERGIGERDGAALYDSSPGRREGRTWKPISIVYRTAYNWNTSLFAI